MLLSSERSCRCCHVDTLLHAGNVVILREWHPLSGAGIGVIVTVGIKQHCVNIWTEPNLCSQQGKIGDLHKHISLLKLAGAPLCNRNDHRQMPGVANVHLHVALEEEDAGVPRLRVDGVAEGRQQQCAVQHLSLLDDDL